MIQKHRVLLLKNPLGTIINLLIIYSQWWAGIYAKNKYIALIIISAKILLITSLPLGLVIFYWNLWNREYIEEVQIFATETIGCEGRSQYYETAGVVRDMLQNHMLQVLSLIAMEAPCRMNAVEIRREKTKVLAATRLGEDLICGQYESYRNEEGVDSNSSTPTYCAGSLYIDNWRWKGVPFRFMTGKKMPYQCVEVIIKLKSPPLSYFGEETSDRIVIRLQPYAHLDIRIDVKSPGLNDNVEPATLTHRYPDWLGVDGYEKLFLMLLMVINHTLFILKKC